MDTLIQVHKEGDWFIAVDLATQVADQGKTREEVICRLKTGLEEHYEVLLDLIEKDSILEILTVKIPENDSTSSPVIA